MEINARKIQTIAEETGFIRDNLEKVMRLMDILEMLFTSPYSNRLALKGGTAINLFYAGMPRLSVDIDLDYVGEDRETMVAEKASIKDWLSAATFGKGYRLSAQSKETHALDSFVLSYRNAVGNQNVIKVEINYLDRVHVLPLAKKRIHVFGYESSIDIALLEKNELYASKIAALVTRGKPRDLFDVHHALSQGIIETGALLRKCALFYDCVGGKNSIAFKESFDFQNLTKKDFQRMLMPMLRKGFLFDHTRGIEEVSAFLRDLFHFEPNEVTFSKSFMVGEYRPELLFGESEETRRIGKHPMALWRMRNR